MFKRIVFSACLAGFIAGLILTSVQMVQVVPLILEAETYEGGDPAALTGHIHAAHGHHHGQEAPQDGVIGRYLPGLYTFQHAESDWGPEDGWQRTLYTAIANCLIGIGFALLLAAIFSLRPNVGPGQGALWGLAGYAAFFVLPGLGLPPEIPGAVAADLLDRQVWWLLTVTCSASGLALLLLRREWFWKVAGAVLVVVPHLIGAPHPEVHGGSAPQALADAFVWASAIANGIFWLLLGGLTALTFRKLA